MERKLQKLTRKELQAHPKNQIRDRGLELKTRLREESEVTSSMLKPLRANAKFG